MRTESHRTSSRNAGHSMLLNDALREALLIDCSALLIRVVAKNTESKFEAISYAL
jgi:hypothetical protein